LLTTLYVWPTPSPLKFVLQLTLGGGPTSARLKSSSIPVAGNGVGMTAPTMHVALEVLVALGTR
jgi:hypothetical protein